MSGAQGGGIEALCLEEMLKRRVERGALFYGQRKRRTDVLFDEALRALTSDSAHRLHALIIARYAAGGAREEM